MRAISHDMTDFESEYQSFMMAGLGVHVNKKGDVESISSDYLTREEEISNIQLDDIEARDAFNPKWPC